MAVLVLGTAGCGLGAGQLTEPAGSGNLDLQGIHVVDAATGWAVSGHFVLHTTDGTASWENVTPRDTFLSAHGPLVPPIGAWAARDGLRAWVVVDVEGRGVLYRTDDGGLTWESATAPLPGGSLVVAGDGEAWLAGPSRATGTLVVERTQDGGSHWQPVASLSPARPAALVGGAQGSLWLIAPPELRVSDDGGRTWGRGTLPSLPAGARVQLLPLGGPRAVMAAITRGETQFYLTADAGGSWQQTGTLPQPALACFLADGRGWAAEQAPGAAKVTVLATADGGRHWTREGSLSAPGIRQLQFAGAHAGWLLAGGAVHSTDDGGRTWRQFPGRVMAE